MISAYLGSNDVTGDIVPYFKAIFNGPSAGTGAGITLTELDMGHQKVLKSLKIKEKEAEIPTGEFLFESNDLSKEVKFNRFGTLINLEWGIKNVDYVLSFSKSKTNEVSGFVPRYANVAIVNMPVNLHDGIVGYNAQFRLCQTTQYDPHTETFSSGTVQQMVLKVITRMKAVPGIIDFPLLASQLTPQAPVIQSNVNDIAFLRQIAYRYNCKLNFMTNSSGVIQVFMMDWVKATTANYVGFRGFVVGQYHFFDYGTPYSNIISGSFNSNVQSANGSSYYVTTGSSGQVQVVFTASGQDTAEVWSLNPDAIRAALQKGSIRDKATLLQEIMKAGTADLVKTLYGQYFTKQPATTYPEGAGSTGNLQVAFNTNYQVGDLVYLGSAKSTIPPNFKSSGLSEDGSGVPNKFSLWRIVELETNITESGPSMNVGLAR